MVQFDEIKGFLFDLHGILTDSWLMHLSAWRQLADSLGIDWDPSLDETIKGRSRIDTLNTILASVGLENKYSDEEKEKITDQKNELYQKLIDTMTPADRLPGVMNFLNELKSQGYKMAIASASENAPREIQKLELEDYFPVIVDVHDLKANKPAPDVYLKAAELLGLEPSQCIGIDDGEVGIEAINAANEIAIGIGDKDILNTADINFASTTDLTLANIKANW